MSDKLAELVSSIENHVRDKRSELTAIQTQARALQSAHNDLLEEVEKEQGRLLDVRNAIAESSKELEERRTEAQRIASGIISAAHDELTRAQGEAAKLREQYSAAVKIADDQLIEAQEEMKAKEEMLRALDNDIGIKRTELAALKHQARQFADA